MMNSQKLTFTFPSSNGKDTIYGVIWTPLTPPKAILQVTHGMCEYIERYEEFAQFLNGYGVIVCGHDHLGHGQTVTEWNQNDLGYFGEKDGYQYLVKDVRQCYLEMKKRYPDLPYFLLGHSMGSFITRKYITKYGKELDGYICCGTSGPRRGHFKITLADWICKLKGTRHRSKLLQSLVFFQYNRRCRPRNQTPYAWVCSDRQVTEEYENDPKCTFIFTASGFRDLFHLLTEVSQKAWASKVPKKLPFLLIAGKSDPVGNYGKGVWKVRNELYFANLKDLECILYPNMRHEILNEVGKLKVYNDILDWILNHVKKKKTTDNTNYNQ